MARVACRRDAGRRAARTIEHGRRPLRRHPVRAGEALRGPRARARVERRARGNRRRPGRATAHATARRVQPRPAASGVGELSQPQRVDAARGRRRPASGARVDPRRWIRARRRECGHQRRRASRGSSRHRGGHAQLPARQPRLALPPRSRGGARRSGGKLGPARPDRGARVGARLDRGVRRRPVESHRRGSVRRCVGRARPARRAARERALPASDRAVAAVRGRRRRPGLRAPLGRGARPRRRVRGDVRHGRPTSPPCGRDRRAARGAPRRPRVPGHPRRCAPDARSGQPAGLSGASPRREPRRRRADRIERRRGDLLLPGGRPAPGARRCDARRDRLPLSRRRRCRRADRRLSRAPRRESTRTSCSSASPPTP